METENSPELTQFLQEQLYLLQAIGRVTPKICAILDFNQLLGDTVNLIREYVGDYHVSLYLLDEKREWIIMRAGTGEAGKALLRYGYKIEINDSSLIGWCVQHRQARIVDQFKEPINFHNPLVFEMDAAIALPLIDQNEVIGVLELQGWGIFPEEYLPALQIMTDHIVVAMENALLFDRLQKILHSLENNTVKE